MSSVERVESLPVTSPALFVVSCVTVRTSSPDVRSVTGSTVTLTVTVDVNPSASVTVTVKLSVPLKFALGVYVHAPVVASIDTVPFAGTSPASTRKFGVVMPSAVSVTVSVPVIAPPSSAPLPDVSPPNTAASSADGNKAW